VRARAFLTRAPAALLLLCLLVPAESDAQTAPGTPIDNEASASFTLAGSPTSSLSNLVTVTTVALRTSATLELLQYAPSAPGPMLVDVAPSSCGATPAPPPTDFSGSPIPLGSPVPLMAPTQLHLGEPIFVRLVDLDQNLDSGLAETVAVALAIGATGDSETLTLTETGLATGVFTGHTQLVGPPAGSDCALSGVAGASLAGSYVDAADPTDTASDSAPISPESRVFDSLDGSLLDGAAITLVDAATGLPAPVLGDDGVSTFPSTITSGATASDSGGTVYAFGSGGYRFPVVGPGSYRLEIVPPSGYIYASSAPDSQIQALPGAPYAIVLGSRGESFAVGASPALDIDVPLDSLASTQFLSKQASKDTVAIGEFLQYSVDVVNPGVGGAPLGVEVSDRLPLGFRYREDSTRIDDLPAPDPAIDADARTLTFTLPATAAPSRTNIRYTVEVTANAPIGAATNRAASQALGGPASFTAKATVEVRDELLQEQVFLMGQVVVGSCDADLTNDLEGLEGARVYLEDGTYALSDERGMFHFEGVQPGVHVLQLDPASLPPTYEVVPCEQNTRFAGRATSQFTDVQPGTLWRTDFHVRLRPPVKGELSQSLGSLLQGDTLWYELQVRSATVPLRNVRGVVILPDGVEYIAGSSRRNGAPGADPRVNGSVLTFALGDTAEDLWLQSVQFRVRVTAPEEEREELKARSMVMFDSPKESQLRMPVAFNFANQDALAADAFQAIETSGLRPGEVREEARQATPEPAPTSFDASWIEQAEPGLEWLRPGPEFRPQVPALRIAVKHHPRHTLSLRLNSVPVSALNFDGRIANAAKTVAVSHWRGVDIEEGDNQLVLIVTDEHGTEVGRLEKQVHYPGPPARAELIETESRLTADGRTPPVVAVRLLDRSGAPAREGVVGPFRVDAPYAARVPETIGHQRKSDSDDPSWVTDTEGIARIELEPTSRSGGVVLRLRFGDREQEIRAWLEPESREWVLVGLAEGKLTQSDFSGDDDSLDDLGFEEGLHLDRRLALFAKGTVRDDWLVTFSYDSERDFEDDRSTLHRTIDPDRYYPLYGDTSQQEYDAPSQSHLFARVERQGFYALYGDYDTALNETELSRYNRSFNGLQSAYRGDRFSFSGFGSKTSQAFVKDEIRGDGTSGLYRLSRIDLVENSEKITIETRDRFNSQEILESRPLARHLDYSIDYLDGSLFFKEPIPNRDQNLNPVFIVVDYEADDDSDDELIAGGRGAVHLWDDRLELGASAIHEGHKGNRGDLHGLDLRLDLTDAAQLRLEYARSETNALAGDCDGAAYLAELEHRSERLEARAYYREQKLGFGLGQQNTSESGTRKFGAEAQVRLDDHLRLHSAAFRQTNLETEADRDVFEARADFTVGRSLAYGGYRLVRERDEDPSDDLSQQLIAGGAVSALNDRLTLRLDSELAFGGRNDVSDYTTRAILGADFRLLKDVSLFAEQEFTFGPDEDTADTRLGIKATPWKGGRLRTSLEQESAENGARLFANVGLDQTWQLSKVWGLSFSLNRSATLRHPGSTPFNADVPPASGTADDDFTSISFGTSHQLPDQSWSSRLEFRHGSVEDKWGFFTGFHREIDEGIGYSASLKLFDTDTDQDEKTEADLSFGFVYRPLASRWIVLDRLEFAFEDQDGDGFDFRSRRLVNNLNANFSWNRYTQLSFKYGAKYVLDRIDDEDLAGFTDLVGVEMRRDLGQRFDFGTHARVRHSWDSELYDSSVGVSLGYRVVTNLWVSFGYNFTGFRDRDFSDSDYTSQGAYFQFRYKFDHHTIRDLLLPNE
jgi:uncharacterized repeat protein (TIGR01451 family)